MVFGWRGRKGQSPIAADPPAPDRTYRPGDVIGGDWLVRKVMEGGLGVVYAVEHREGDWGRHCVLKAPKGQSNKAVRESFRTEAETWVRLGDHPNIVRALGVDEFAGQLFIIAELVEPDQLNRVSLRDYLRWGPLSPHAVAAWTADFCHGLEHASSKGLVAHRDIKPENLLIGSSGVLRITDFGIARAMIAGGEAGQVPEAKLGVWQTAGGHVAGTLPYMAPEQWLSAKQDLRTDIYAFGVTMYEMCYGRFPFAGPDFKSQHLRTEPHIPPGIFAAIIQRCLAKDPAARYAKPLSLLDDMSTVCRANRLPLPPKPKVAGQKARDLFALVQALTPLGKFDEAIAAGRQLVELEPDSAENWTELARALIESGDLAAAREAMERSLSLDATRSPAWNNFGVLLKRQERWQQAIAAFDRALDCDPSNTGAMLNCTAPLQRLGRGGEAIVRLKRAADIAPDKYSIWNNLGAVYIDTGDKQNALQCLRKARALAPERYHSEIDRSIQFAQTLPDEPSGTALMATDPVLARKRFQEDTRRDPRNKNAWHNLGLLHLQAKEHADARECFARVLALDPQDSYAICRLIELSAELKDPAAVERWSSVLAQMRNGQMAAIAFRARGLVKCDRYDDARKLILDAVRQYPEEPEILIACGDVMMTYPDSSTAMSNASAAYKRAVTILERGIDIRRLREIEGRLKLAQRNLLRLKREDGLLPE